MTSNPAQHQDLAMVIAWPDKTARGDEQWMALLKRTGIVKNLNFKVGHAAILLIHRESGQLCYYDFGRYITPRGYGRARSAEFDPRLRLSVRAQIDENDQITNLHAILEELHQIEDATHGGGRLFFSIASGICHAKSGSFAQKIVNQGPIKYGALANGNNSCSRFVAQVLLAGLVAKHPAITSLLLPESLKPSPMSNVVNAVPARTIHCYQDGLLHHLRMTRWQSLRFQMELLLHNISPTKARALPCDRQLGYIEEPERPSSVPHSAQWLGGIGEGAWYFLEGGVEQDMLMVVRYAHDGKEDYRVACTASQPVAPNTPHKFTYDCHLQRHTIVQHGVEITLETINHCNWRIRTA